MSAEEALLNGIKIGLDRNKPVFEVILSKLKTMREHSEDILYIDNSHVYDFTSEISFLIGYIESHLEEVYDDESNVLEEDPDLKDLLSYKSEKDEEL